MKDTTSNIRLPLKVSVWFYLLVLSSLFISSFPSHADSPQPWAAIMDNIFLPALETNTYAGAAVVVVQNNQIAFIKGYGKADNKGSPFTPKTRSYLGSVSKSFTALATIELARQGKLKLDAPVKNYLPNFSPSSFAPNGDSTAITIRQLLNHTSGFSRYTGNINQDDQIVSPNALQQVVNALNGQSLATPPNTAFDYSNANYQVLGRVIEVVNKQPFAHSLQELIFTPLNLEDSTISHDFNHPQAADGYRYWGFWLVPHQEPMGTSLMPQGGVSTTITDMGTYLISLLGGNETVPNLYHPEIAQGHNLGAPENNYAAGWFVQETQGNLTLIHRGLNGGFTAAAAFQPNKGKGVAVIINTGDGFFTGDINYLHDSALNAVFAEIEVNQVNYTPQFIQGLVLIGLIITLVIWILKVGRGGIPTTHYWWRLTLPTLGLLLLSYNIGVVLPQLFGIPLSGISVFNPDVGLLLTACAGLSLVWALLRMLLLVVAKLKR